jgi:hypothetical protein
MRSVEKLIANKQRLLGLAGADAVGCKPVAALYAAVNLTTGSARGQGASHLACPARFES